MLEFAEVRRDFVARRDACNVKLRQWTKGSKRMASQVRDTSQSEWRNSDIIVRARFSRAYFQSTPYFNICLYRHWSPSVPRRSAQQRVLAHVNTQNGTLFVHETIHKSNKQATIVADQHGEIVVTIPLVPFSFKLPACPAPLLPDRWDGQARQVQVFFSIETSTALVCCQPSIHRSFMLHQYPRKISKPRGRRSQAPNANAQNNEEEEEEEEEEQEEGEHEEGEQEEGEQKEGEEDEDGSNGSEGGEGGDAEGGADNASEDNQRDRDRREREPQAGKRLRRPGPSAASSGASRRDAAQLKAGDEGRTLAGPRGGATSSSSNSSSMQAGTSLKPKPARSSSASQRGLFARSSVCVQVCVCEPILHTQKHTSLTRSPTRHHPSMQPRSGQRRRRRQGHQHAPQRHPAARLRLASPLRCWVPMQ